MLFVDKLINVWGKVERRRFKEFFCFFKLYFYFKLLANVVIVGKVFNVIKFKI